MEVHADTTGDVHSSVYYFACHNHTPQLHTSDVIVFNGMRCFWQLYKFSNDYICCRTASPLSLSSSLTRASSLPLPLLSGCVCRSV